MLSSRRQFFPFPRFPKRKIYLVLSYHCLISPCFLSSISIISFRSSCFLSSISFSNFSSDTTDSAQKSTSSSSPVSSPTYEGGKVSFNNISSEEIIQSQPSNASPLNSSQAEQPSSSSLPPSIPVADARDFNASPPFVDGPDSCVYPMQASDRPHTEIGKVILRTVNC